MELAVMFISESELYMADPEYSYSWIETNKDKLYDLLYNLGMDITSNLEFQDVTQHRNRLNKIVVCGRWSGLERKDQEWINSGYASRAAKIAASGCKMLGAELNSALKDFQNDKTKVSLLTEVPEDETDIEEGEE